MGEADSPAKREKYQRRVKEGLDRAFADPHVTERELDLEHDRLVIFSDHHRGARDGADDFWRCERAYRAALGYYLEEGHRLFLLGDVEELWENVPRDVLAAYGDTLALEREFYELGRLERFWGNHDDAWRHADAVKAHFERDFPGLVIHEALKLHATRGGAAVGLFFLVHGHQGTLDSDRFGGLSRLVVRYGWRPDPAARQDGVDDTGPGLPAPRRPRRRDVRVGEPPARAPRAHRRPHPQAGVQHAASRSRSERSTRCGTSSTSSGREAPRPTRSPICGPSWSSFAPRPLAIRRRRCPFRATSTPAAARSATATSPESSCRDGEIRLVRWLDDKYEPHAEQLATKPVEEVFEQVRTAARG